MELGFPPQFGAHVNAPFDIISDFLRGTIGAMLDMYRVPDKLLEAMEQILPMTLQNGLAAKQRASHASLFLSTKGSIALCRRNSSRPFTGPH